MQKLIIYILLFSQIITFYSCKENELVKYEKSTNKNDTSCIEELKVAKAMIEKDSLVYCNYTGNIVFYPYRAEEEVKVLLDKYNIHYQNESSPCVIQENRNYHCFCQYMEIAIAEKYGKTFVESLLNKSDSLWVLKNLDKVFENSGASDNWDNPAKFPEDTSYDQTNHSGLQKAFEHSFKYPSNYFYSPKKDLPIMLQVYLFIDEKGKAKVNDFQMCAWAKVNEKHYSYFKKEAKKIIEETTWEPAKIKNIGVKSNNDIFIYLK